MCFQKGNPELYFFADGKPLTKTSSRGIARMQHKDGKAYLRMEYSDYNAYKLFTGNELFVGTVGEAKAAGYDFQDTFSSVSDEKKGDAITVEDMTSDDEKKVILVKANETVVAPNDITAVSDACTTNNDYVQIMGQHC